MAVPILNLDSARFDCSFGRGCEGVCCRNGRPPVYAEEAARIDQRLEQILPLLRPAARALVAQVGCLSGRRKSGQPMARVAEGWCVFFNRGCVLHRLGESEGDAFRYKPAICAAFPLTTDERGRWYVRQKGYQGEIWDLACLDPASSTVAAATSLRSEIALVQSWDKSTGSTAATGPEPEQGDQGP
jgi:hypothetical protein